jgi:hypothetical protein
MVHSLVLQQICTVLGHRLVAPSVIQHEHLQKHISFSIESRQRIQHSTRIVVPQAIALSVLCHCGLSTGPSPSHGHGTFHRLSRPCDEGTISSEAEPPSGMVLSNHLKQQQLAPATSESRPACTPLKLESPCHMDGQEPF